MAALSVSDLTVVLGRRRISEAIDIASVALLAYDYCITLGMEIELIWMSPWSMMKVLYLVQRYMAFVDSAVIPLPLYFRADLSEEYCHASYKGSGWMFLAGLAISELILTLRAWAVWGKDRRLSYALPVFFVLCWTPNFAFLGIFLNSLTFDPLFPGVGCYVSGASRLLYMCWVLLMIYGAGILILMLIPGISAYRTGGDSALFNVVYRDGVVYYIYIFVLEVINVAVVLVLPSDYATLLATLARVIHCLLASRVLLHIRAQAHKEPVYLDGLTAQMLTVDAETLDFHTRTTIGGVLNA